MTPHAACVPAGGPCWPRQANRPCQRALPNSLCWHFLAPSRVTTWFLAMPAGKSVWQQVGLTPRNIVRYYIPFAAAGTHLRTMPPATREACCARLLAPAACAE